ncbi:MAG TPA: rhomboid family intramembrane serine protease [bacterium]|nr:rhomboid family intramembrane serine protease [bacterium]HPR87352.1 rhomboid family intramembrane serine protease [bacterium]
MSSEKQIGARLCPNCRRLISVNAKECIHCGWKNYGLSGFGTGFEKIIRSLGGLVPVLIGFTILLYFASLMLDLSALISVRSLFGLLAPSGGALYRLGMTGAVPLAQGQWWTLFTAIYLHGGILHIFFNMLWLRNIGYAVDEFFGTSRAFIIFTVAGVTGFLASDLLRVPFTVGASGSIFGLLGALIFYGRHRGGAYGEALMRQVGSWALMAFLFGFFFPGVNNWAHAGGFAGGYLCAMLLKYQEIARERTAHRIAALGLALITLAGFFLSLFRAA